MARIGNHHTGSPRFPPHDPPDPTVLVRPMTDEERRRYGVGAPPTKEEGDMESRPKLPTTAILWADEQVTLSLRSRASEALVWMSPRRDVLNLTLPVVDALGHPARVRIGVDRVGRALVLAPQPETGPGYRLTPKGSRAILYCAVLWPWLQAQGYPGTRSRAVVAEDGTVRVPWDAGEEASP